MDRDGLDGERWKLWLDEEGPARGWTVEIQGSPERGGSSRASGNLDQSSDLPASVLVLNGPGRSTLTLVVCTSSVRRATAIFEDQAEEGLEVVSAPSGDAMFYFRLGERDDRIAAVRYEPSEGSGSVDLGWYLRARDEQR